MQRCLVGLVLLSSCGLFEAHGEEDHFNRTDTVWMDVDATRRAIFYVGEGGAVGANAEATGPMILAEPAPDATLSRSLDLASKIDLTVDPGTQTGSGTLEQKLQIIETAVELAGQAERVKVLREALYRLSELHFNGALSQKGSTAPLLYLAAIHSITQMEVAKREEAKAEILRDVTRSLRALDTDRRRDSAQVHELIKAMTYLSKKQAARPEEDLLREIEAHVMELLSAPEEPSACEPTTRRQAM